VSLARRKLEQRRSRVLSSLNKLLDMSATGLDNELFASAEFFIASEEQRAVWRLRGRVHTPVRKRAERGDMKTERGPPNYLTQEELRQIAAAKLVEAAALPAGFQQDELLRSAENFRHLAEIKGWLASELRPPKSP
jgi:hypothetical protein